MDVKPHLSIERRRLFVLFVDIELQTRNQAQGASQQKTSDTLTVMIGMDSASIRAAISSLSCGDKKSCVASTVARQITMTRAMSLAVDLRKRTGGSDDI